jgi:hypothetical protein
MELVPDHVGELADDGGEAGEGDRAGHTRGG